MKLHCPGAEHRFASFEREIACSSDAVIRRSAFPIQTFSPLTLPARDSSEFAPVQYQFRGKSTFRSVHDGIRL